MAAPEEGPGAPLKQNKPTDKADFATVRDAFVERAKAVRDSGDEDGWAALLMEAGNYAVDRWIAQAAIALEDCASEQAWKRAQLREIDNLTFGNLARVAADATEVLDSCRLRHAAVVSAESVVAIGKGLAHELEEVEKNRPHRLRRWLGEELQRIALAVLVLAVLASLLRNIPAGINSQGRHLSDELFGTDPEVVLIEQQIRDIQQRLPKKP